MNSPVNFIAVDRYWFLTWITYGSWLPGSKRGFVGTALDEAGQHFNFNEPGTPPAMPNPALQEFARRNLKSPPQRLNHQQAKSLLEQFQETARFRGWLVVAAGIMRTHIHIVTGVPGDPDPEKILGDFKACGSRILNRESSWPAGNTWWSTGGSKRTLKDEQSVEAAVNYIRNQSNPLAIWPRENGMLT